MADAVIRIICPNLACGRVLAVPPDARGELVRCSACRRVIKVPSVRSQAAEPSASAAPDTVS
jgi:hypothetical protein